jgi:hypothetical protein
MNKVVRNLFWTEQTMIKSKFISGIVDLTLDGDDIGHVRHQKDYLVEKDFEFTGVGLFVNFAHLEGINNFKSENEKLIIDGPTIASNELKIGASVTMFFKDGLVNYIDIWSFDGNFPIKELETYTLTQEWKGSPGKKLVVE